MNPTLIEIKNIVPRIDSLAFSQPITWSINKDQHWAVIGPNGAGKTLLIDILIGKYALKSGEIICNDEKGNSQSIRKFVKFVAFRDIYSLTDMKNSYYQQRWNAGLEEEIATVKDILDKEPGQTWINSLVSAFAIEDLLNKKINLLSSGELRKFLIIRSLSAKPRILILDNPFIGLDAHSRVVLKEVLGNLSKIENLQIILILSDIADIPPMITHVLPIRNKSLLPSMDCTEFLDDEKVQNTIFDSEKKITLPKSTQKKKENLVFENALLFKNINIKYGYRTILKELSWQVKRGEKWALLGENGSGKSTLLSLVAGDNPQAYANDITLFDRKRGSGESIWDIKKHIGYISPEMHLYYLKNVRCLDVVGSGFFDTIGLYKKCTQEQEEITLQWMKTFGVENIKDTSFLHISTGEQRLVLLARVFVKDPNLLILDEPLHGLDMANKHRIKKIIENFCTQEKTLIYVTHYKEEIPDVVDQQLVLTKQQ